MNSTQEVAAFGRNQLESQAGSTSLTMCSHSLRSRGLCLNGDIAAARRRIFSFLYIEARTRSQVTRGALSGKGTERTLNLRWFARKKITIEPEDFRSNALHFGRGLYYHCTALLKIPNQVLQARKMDRIRVNRVGSTVENPRFQVDPKGPRCSLASESNPTGPKYLPVNQVDSGSTRRYPGSSASPEAGAAISHRKRLGPNRHPQRIRGILPP